MPEIRSVSVHLDADVASYIAKMKLAGDATDRAFSNSSRHIDTTNRSLSTTATSLDKVGSSATKVDTSMRKLGDDVDVTGRKLDNGGKSIDKYSGRLALLGDAALVLGPAAVTSAAVAVPALAAVGSELGFLAAGVGTGKLAFLGFGTALKAFNKAALDPTVTNIAAAQLAMSKLPPDAQRLVLQLHNLSPEFERLQRAAGTGLFRGVSAGLRDVVSDAPIAQRGLRGIGLELGDLARDAGQSLSSRAWKPFLRFVGREAPASLDATARSAGHVTHGLAELWMAFDPVNADFDAGIRRVAEDFDRWATGLGRTKGFQDFLDYYRENGPRVIALLGQTATTLIDIGEAAAPIGGPVLTALTDVLKVVDLIAKSDLGTPLLGGLLAFRLYARVAQLAGVQVETSFKGMAAAPGQVKAKITDLAASTRTSTTSMIADLRAMGAEYQREARTIQTSTRSLFPSGVGAPEFFNPLNTSRTVDNETKSVGRLKSTYLSFLGQTSEAAVRTKARLGEVAKSGAAAAGVGLVASGIADKAGLANTATLGLIGTVAGPYGAAIGGAIGFTLDLVHANANLVASQHEVEAAFKDTTSQINFSAQAGDLGQLNTQLDATYAKVHQLQTFSTSNPLKILNGVRIAANNAFTGSFDNAQNAANQAATDLGKNLTVFTELGDKLQGKFDPVARSTAQLQQVADRAQPAMLALGITVGDLQDAYDANDGSLDHLIGRIVTWTNRSDSAGAKTQAVAKAFAQMGDETLTTDQRVQALSNSLDALLGPTLGLSAASDQYTKDLHTLRSELAKGSKTLQGNSDAALQNRGAIRSRVSDLSDLIKAEANAGASPEKLTRTLRTQRQALIDAGAAAGISRSQMRDYLNELGLTPKLIHTAIELAGTADAERNLQNLTRDRVIHITVRTDHLGLQDTTATGGHVLTGRAAGGTIGGPRYPYRDKVLTPTAPGEEVISNDRGQADMNRGALKAANRGARLAVIDGPGMAGGGTVPGHVATLPNIMVTNPGIDYRRLAEMVAELRPPQPLYGDVHINGDPTTFRRQMAQDRGLSNIDGRRGRSNR